MAVTSEHHLLNFTKARKLLIEENNGVTDVWQWDGQTVFMETRNPFHLEIFTASSLVSSTENWHISIELETMTKFCNYSGNDTHIRIDPSVTSIPDKAFINQEKLVEVELPSSLQAIGNEAFMGCASLKSIQLCEGLQTIGISAFQACTSLSRVKIPSTVTTIDNSAFCGCTSLEAAHLYEGLQIICGRAFYGCKTLSTVSIPFTVKEISRHAFDSCTSLAGVQLCEGLGAIDVQAFYECKSLRQVVIPSTVSAIDDCAFGECTSLKEVNLREGLRDIGVCAFNGCLSLMHINVPATVHSIDRRAFGHCSLLRNVSISPSSTLGEEHFREAFETFRNAGVSFEMLKRRFHDLPIHKLCHERSPQTMEYVNRTSSAELSKVDCLGMTPLHVLACSGTHDLALYRRIIEICPNTLIAEDKWGEISLSYVILSEAPKEVLHFFLEMHRRNEELGPFCFVEIIERLALYTSGEYLRNVIQAQRTYFPDFGVDWSTVGKGIFHEVRYHHSIPFPDNKSSSTIFQVARVILEASLSHRSICMSLEHQVEIDNLIDRRREVRGSIFDLLVRPFAYAYSYEDIRQMVIDYAQLHHNQLVDGTSILEMALWKAKMNEALQLNPNITLNDGAIRKQIRTDSGNDFNVVITNVLLFL